MLKQNHKKTRQKNAQSIGANIRRLRLQKQLSQKELAKIMGVSYQQLQKYETGANRFPADRMFVLHRALDMPFSSFFEGLDGAEDEMLRFDWIKQVECLKNPFLRNRIERVVSILLEVEA
jgi:transcriptional regulator with XRE-family HTH domain